MLTREESGAVVGSATTERVPGLFSNSGSPRRVFYKKTRRKKQKKTKKKKKQTKQTKKQKRIDMEMYNFMRDITY
jgi:hypothetical protein